MRVCFAVLILATTVSACGSGNGGRRPETSSSVHTSSAAISQVERCVDRLMEHATQDVPDKEIARHYVRRTYCARFEKNGWVYADGALRIAAQTWLDHGATCATQAAGESAKTVPCEPEQQGGVRVIECALLRVIRRSEVIDYIEQLRKSGLVECDDGTAIGELGVPQAGDSGEDPTGVPNPPGYTGPAPTTTVEGWHEPGTSR